MSAHFLGIDVGTSGVKGVLIGSDGRLEATATDGYPLSIPRPLWSEQDPHDWWRATGTTVRSLLEQTGIDPVNIGAVGLTGQMHGLVLLDSDGDVIRPAILWNDQRTADQCDAITATVGRDEILRRLGNPVLPGFTAPKIMWVRDEEPEAYRRTEAVLLPKDYVRYRLTGAYAGDVSDASGTALFNVAQRSWDNDTFSLNIAGNTVTRVTMPVAGSNL